MFSTKNSLVNKYNLYIYATIFLIGIICSLLYSHFQKPYIFSETNCYVDIPKYPAEIESKDPIHYAGWAISENILWGSKNFYIQFSSKDLQITQQISADKIARPDVNHIFKLDSSYLVGYDVTIPENKLKPGTYSVSLIEEFDGNRFSVCTPIEKDIKIK
jgi:hypothetical protein